MLVVGLLGGCATAETEIENAEKAGVDPMDAAFAPLDDTVDEINEKLNAPRDGASGNTD
jgi:hypothetical protein